ncbi:MAG TPA: hypothetical protein VNN10_04680 [Dehalococcoidia bacterium]|nr:hypothetical protein [Dehalococcoidia bacterium]
MLISSSCKRGNQVKVRAVVASPVNAASPPAGDGKLRSLPHARSLRVLPVDVLFQGVGPFEDETALPAWHRLGDLNAVLLPEVPLE